MVTINRLQAYAPFNRVIDRDEESRSIARFLRDQDIEANEYYASLLNEIRHGLVLDFIYTETAGKYIDFDCDNDTDVVSRLIHNLASGDPETAAIVLDAIDEVWND